MKNHKSVSLFLLFLSISNLYSIASLSEELKGFNKLFLKLKKINVIEENVVSKFDEIKLIGITNIKNTLIVLQINGNPFEIIQEKEKHGYKLLKVEGTSAHLLKDNLRVFFYVYIIIKGIKKETKQRNAPNESLVLIDAILIINTNKPQIALKIDA